MPRGGFRGALGVGGMTGGRHESKLTAEQHEAIGRRYAQGEKSRALATAYGVTVPSILYHLRKQGVRRRGVRGRTYTINEAAFDVLTDDAAYWAGFLMADGCVHDEGTNKRISLALQTRDVGHVQSFAAFIGTNKPVRKKGDKGTGTWGVDVYSRPMAARLATLGITPRKSLTAKAAPEVSGNRNFWRGLLDGDGSVRRRDDGFASVYQLGAPLIAEQFAAYVAVVAPRSRVHAYPYSDRRCYRITLSGSTAVAFLRDLYRPGDTALPRKAAIARALIAEQDDKRAGQGTLLLGAA